MILYRPLLAYNPLPVKEGGGLSCPPPSRSLWLVIMCFNPLLLSSASNLEGLPGPLSSPVSPTRR
jgi:hypothetical protein